MKKKRTIRATCSQEIDKNENWEHIQKKHIVKKEKEQAKQN